VTHELIDGRHLVTCSRLKSHGAPADEGTRVKDPPGLERFELVFSLQVAGALAGR
jgi:hypothetical protein